MRVAVVVFFALVTPWLLAGCGDRAGGVNVWTAVADDDADAVRRYAKAGGDLEVTDFWGRTPVLVAFVDKRFDSYQALLKSGANPNVEANNGDALMVYAACTEDSKWLREALTHGGDPDYFNAKAPPRHRSTALLSAIHSHCTGNAIMLIDAGADVNLLPPEQPTRDTPLVETLGTNEFGVTLKLLEAGADYRSPAGESQFVSLLKERMQMTYRSQKLIAERTAVIEWLKNRGVKFDDAE